MVILPWPSLALTQLTTAPSRCVSSSSDSHGGSRCIHTPQSFPCAEVRDLRVTGVGFELKDREADL